jgi:hypothetical protein
VWSLSKKSSLDGTLTKEEKNNMSHKHWCEIAGHMFDCGLEHEPDYPFYEEGYPVELRSDCPEHSGFHLWKISQWLEYTIWRKLGYVWRHYVCHLPFQPYWRWKCARLICKCGKRIPLSLSQVYAIFEFTSYQCGVCTPPCAPDCPGCEAEKDPGVICSFQHKESTTGQ